MSQREYDELTIAARALAEWVLSLVVAGVDQLYRGISTDEAKEAAKSIMEMTEDAQEKKP